MNNNSYFEGERMKECKECNHEHIHEHNHDGEEENVKLEIIKMAISLVVFIVAIINRLPQQYAIWVYVIAYILSGYEVLIKSIKNIFKGEVFDENFLMSIATIGAFIIDKPIEAVAVMIFYNIGELFEELATDRSKKSIIQLMNLKPKIANLKTNNETREVDPEELKVGDIIIIKPGEKVPVDGIIVVGETTINTSAITRRVSSKKSWIR